MLVNRLLSFLFAGSLACCAVDNPRAAEITAIPLAKSGEAAILVEGTLAYEDRERFLAKVSTFQSGMVVFNSEGGSAIAGIEIGKAIRLRNFVTWVPSGKFCVSACAAAWLGGSRRFMGKDALIGFHSVFTVEQGTAKETAPGNALFGAYLAQLGLSDRAIFYLTNAGPDSMAWLTPERADALDIKVSLYDEQPKTPQAPPQIAEPLESRARNFVVAVNVLVSGSNDKLISILPGLYSDPVTYFGKPTSRDDVVSQITAFTNRWPSRSYAVNPSSVKVDCNNVSQHCSVTGRLDFDAKNIQLNRRSRGSATFEYLVQFRPNQRWPTIFMENGKVIDREISELNGARIGGN